MKLTGDSLAQTLAPREKSVTCPLFYISLGGSSCPEAPPTKAGQERSLLECAGHPWLHFSRATFRMAGIVNRGQ